MEKKILPITSDIIFKMFFGDKRNVDILTEFLKAVLRIPVEDYDEVIIVDPHLLQEYPKDKNYRKVS